MDSESEYSESCSPSNVVVAANSVSENFLPNKSRQRYELVYKKFMDWRKDNKIKSFSENVFLNYVNKISNDLKPSTMWSVYSMLRNTINIKHNVDISKYTKLKAFLKRKSRGFRSKKAKMLTTQQIQTFINDAPNDMFLFTKVVLIFGITGACRTHELRDLEINNIEDLEKALLVTIPNTKTHMPRSFTITGKYYGICKKYKNLRPLGINDTTSRFFLNYKNGKCTKQVVGINKFGNVPKKIASFLNLPDVQLYTGHSLRSSTTVVADTRANLTEINQVAGWKSYVEEEQYIEDSINNKLKRGQKIFQSLENVSETTNISETVGIKQENENTNKSNFEPDIYNQIYENFIDSARSNDSILSEEPYTIMKYEPLSPPPLLPLEIDYEEGNHPNDQRNENILLDQLSDKTMENVSFNRVNTTHRNKGAKSEEKGLFCNNRIPESNPEETDNFDFKNKIQEVRKIKNKWKYLRDYFNKETKNIEKTKPEITTAESPISSPYHSLLSFLKDILNTPLRDSTDMQVGRSHEIEEIDLDDEDKDTDDTASQFNDAFSPSSSVNKTPSRPSSRSSHTQNINKKHNQKRPLLTDDNEGIKKRRTQELPACAAQKQDDDDDLLFLKSLLPYMKSLPPSRKMRLRLKFQEFVLEQLEQNDSQNNLEEPFPRFIHTTSSTPSCSASDT